jgi:hypothetical protein
MLRTARSQSPYKHENEHSTASACEHVNVELMRVTQSLTSDVHTFNRVAHPSVNSAGHEIDAFDPHFASSAMLIRPHANACV